MYELEINSHVLVDAKYKYQKFDENQNFQVIVCP